MPDRDPAIGLSPTPSQLDYLKTNDRRRGAAFLWAGSILNRQRLAVTSLPDAPPRILDRARRFVVTCTLVIDVMNAPPLLPVGTIQ